MAHIDYSTLRRFEDLLASLIASQRTIIALLSSVLEKEDDIMALADDLKAGIAKLDAETTTIATLITDLAGRVHNNMTDQEVADIKAALQAESDRLTTLGVDPTNPVPPVPAPLAAARKKKP